MNGPRHIRGVVIERRNVTGALWIVRIRPEEKIPFLPGQYVTLGRQIENKLIERPYSVASAPQEPELEFFLEVVPEGKLTPRLHEVAPGGEVYLRPIAKGRFIFDDQSGNRNHWMLATVTGVAPYVSMVRYLDRTEPRRWPAPYRITILHSASVSEEFGYRQELTRLAEKQGWLEYIPTISRPWLDPEWEGERGRIEDIARKYLDAGGFPGSPATIYLCGNPRMIHKMEGVLERAGFLKESIRRENYWPDPGPG